MAASPNDVWILVADVTRMGNWSPEATGASWVKGANAPAVGAHFTGVNQKDSKSWKTECVVTACEPGERFGFDVKAGPFKVARWTYEFRPTEGGCQVTERWDDQRNWLTTQISPLVTGMKDRAGRNRETMKETLDRIAAAVERR
jgi:Polyketide cyclase / dehydrase and lipid transport